MKVKRFTRYKTRNDSMAEIYRTDVVAEPYGPGTLILGCVHIKNGGWNMLTWTPEGRMYHHNEDGPYDLVEPMGPVLWSVEE